VRSQAQRTGGRVGELCHADPLQHGARPGLGVGTMVVTQERADHHVLQHRQPLEGLRYLEGPGQTKFGSRLRRKCGDVLALEKHLAGSR